MIEYYTFGGINMKRKNNETIISLILMICIIFYFNGLNGVLKFFENLSITFWSVLKMLNLITVQSTGDTILALTFSSGITFMIVGILLELFNIPKGTFGRYFGKISFWLIGMTVSFILNIIGRLIFK